MKTIKLTCYGLATALAFGLTVSCNNDDDDNNGGSATLPPIGGYNSADEVGSADLIAYWPLNGDGKENKSGTNPLTSANVTYVNAIKGQGAHLDAGFMVYPAIANLSSASTGSMSISMWAKVTNNQDTDSHPTMLFTMARTEMTSEWIGNINLMAETGQKASTNDTLTMKGLVAVKMPDDSQNIQDIINSVNPSPEDLAGGHTGNANKNSGRWAHYVITWDGPTGMFRLYANGQKISDEAYESRNGGNPLNLNFFSPTAPVIGTFQTYLAPEVWQQPAKAEMDEIRVFKKTLSAAEINSLYELEKAGR